MVDPRLAATGMAEILLVYKLYELKYTSLYI